MLRRRPALLLGDEVRNGRGKDVETRGDSHDVLRTRLKNDQTSSRAGRPTCRGAHGGFPWSGRDRRQKGASQTGAPHWLAAEPCLLLNLRVDRDQTRRLYARTVTVGRPRSMALGWPAPLSSGRTQFRHDQTGLLILQLPYQRKIASGLRPLLASRREVRRVVAVTGLGSGLLFV